MADTVPRPWSGFLDALDSTLTEAVALHCIGGFVVSLCYGLERPTADVDVLSVTPHSKVTDLIDVAGKGSALARKHRVYLDYVTVASVPENYHGRLREMFPKRFTWLRLFALDPYDLALAKLERNHDVDRDDVRYLGRAIPLDTRVLRQRYESELRPYLARPEREDLTLELWIEAVEEARSANL